jgi:hypothetical protein
MKRLLTLAALLCLVAPAALLAQPAPQDSSVKACKAQRNAIGMSAFRLLYAPSGNPKAATDACLARQALLVATEEKNAAKACRAERGTSPESRAAFEATYAPNGNKKNAFGKCVSMTAAEGVTEQQQVVLNAAKACKTERGTTPATRSAFDTRYGTNANKKNAFGKCVSEAVKAAQP